MSAQVDIDDTSLRIALGTFAVAVERVAKTSARDTATDTASRTRSAVPVRSGQLRESVQVVDDGRDGAGVAMTAPYAGWIEYGGTRGRPYVSQGRYLGPATEGADARMADDAENALRLEAARL